jgi:hypothetical protein
MIKKYEVHNQLTGMLEEAQTFEEAKLLQDRIRNEYMAHIEDLFAITVLAQNPDGSWTQSLSNDEGNPDTNEYYINQLTLE